MRELGLIDDYRDFKVFVHAWRSVEDRFKPSRYLPLCLGKGFFTISLFTTPSDATFNLADVEIIVRGESRFKVNVHVEYDL